MIGRRSPADRAARAARRTERAATLRQLGDASSWLALPMTTARRTPIRRRREEPRRSEQVLDPFIVAAVHELPCAADGMPGVVHEGPIEADHLGPHPYGRKSHDTEVAPLCRRCHANRTNPRTGGRGWFDRLSPGERLAWRAARVVIVQTWFYGRPLTAADLPTVRASVEAGASTRGLFAATNPFPAADGRTEAA